MYPCVVYNILEWNLKVTDQNKIYSAVPNLEDIDNINKLKNHAFFASDIFIYGSSYLYEENPNEIPILIGSDYTGTLFTGNMKKIIKWFNRHEYQFG